LPHEPQPAARFDPIALASAAVLYKVGRCRGAIMKSPPARWPSWLAILSCAASCAANPARDAVDAAGGAGGSTGADAGADGGGAASSGLPAPPSATDVPRPSGAPGNLRVLDWAGFKSAVTYTFDDAQPSQIEHYAELEATGARMTFFITSANSGATAGFDATFSRAVSDGHEMGNHTVHHCQSNLTMCATGSATSLDAELDDCTSYITGHFGQPAVWTAASPYGDTGYDVADATRFFLNRGVFSGTIGPADGTDPFNLPCHAAVAGETLDMFDSTIDSAHGAGRWLIFLVHTILPTSANWYAPIDVSVVTGSISHAQSLGDVWIDSMVNVGAYWRAQKALAGVAPTTSGQAQTWSWTLPAHFPSGKYLRVTVDGGTLSQNGSPVAWDGHGYYEIALDAGSVTVSP
jgi:peptidoglycan/xylan/chitin deacetylase (PgdA/CDA1 family)